MKLFSEIFQKIMKILLKVPESPHYTIHSVVCIKGVLRNFAISGPIFPLFSLFPSFPLSPAF
jgi:hypothetical protein